MVRRIVSMLVFPTFAGGLLLLSPATPVVAQVVITPTPLPWQVFEQTSNGATVVISRSISYGDIAVTSALLLVATVVFLSAVVLVAVRLHGNNRRTQ